MATIKAISTETLESLSTSDHAAEGTETNPDSKPQTAPARTEIVTAKIISAEKLAQQLPVPGSTTEDLAAEAETTVPNRDAGQTKGVSSSTALPNGEPKPTATPPTPPDPGIKNRVQTTAPAATPVDAAQKVNAALTVANEQASKRPTGLSSKTEAEPAVDKNGAPVAQATANTTKEQSTALKATTTKVERQPILQRMAALLHASPGAVEQASGSTLDPAPNPPLIPNRMSLGSFVHEIHLHLAGRQLPDPLKPALKNLVDALAQPLTQPDAVEQWFDFLRQPLSSDSTAGRALQQWALTLLSIRLQQMAATTDPTSSAQQQPHPLLNHEEHQQLTHKLAASLFGQTERFQQLQQDAQQQLPNYVPLPPQQPGDREGGLSMQRSAGKQSPYQWTLSFFIEVPQLGPLQIRACLDVPDIQLQVMAERLSAVDKIKETLPLLEGRFRELGLTPGGFVCRQGKIIPPQTEDEISSASPTAGVSIRI
ncbi:MAG: flagellar hook-length control protein FliK [Aeromonadaceae bacterium]|nr:flagellar hook-length control protein FliK [Aeromonadaceae bacterium]